MFLIVGLGNPDERYKFTRHNLGFMVVEQVAKSFKVSFKKRELFWISSVNFKNKGIIFLKPKTYMNLSGKAVDSVVNKYKIDFSQILVICDDINLPFGTIRIRSRGSDGGQKGLRSVISSLGTQDFPRLRIGIGDPLEDATDYVLSPFSTREQEDLPLILDWASDAVKYFIFNGIELTMGRFNKSILDI